MRVTLVHASLLPAEPAREAFARLWPEAELRHLVDDGLLAERSRHRDVPAAMSRRFVDLARYAIETGAESILFTCSAFGACIDACSSAYPAVPMLKPNEAMIEEACRLGGPIGILATFAPTLASLMSDVPAEAGAIPRLAEGALDALDAGRAEEHDRLVAEAALALDPCRALALGQFSAARAAEAVRRSTGKPVLTAPDCAVRKLRRQAGWDEPPPEVAARPAGPAR